MKYVTYEVYEITMKCMKSLGCCLFFLKKLCAGSSVCVAQTTRRYCHAQTVCFSEDVSLKNVCASSSWCRLDPTTSKIF
ncbi:hypothetical protein HanIR_Chr09g0434971 [Helianthus annuus]|nr:hypothetical protein HanIR_Chr09g0434971 [Helianthus annuus]